MSRHLFTIVVSFGSLVLALPTLSLAQDVQLLVDDHILESKVGLTRIVQQPRRHSSNPIIEAEHEWEGSVLEMPTVFWDPYLKLYRMYYWAIYDSETIYTCYAESRNSINWKKPILGLHQGPDGTTRNNIVLRGEGKVARTRYVVFNPDTSDRQRRYLALYIDNVPGLTEFAASSPDGIHWTTEKKIGDLRHVRGGPVSENPAFFLIEQQWVNDPGDGHRYRSIWRTESPDLLNWTGGKVVVDRLPDDDPDLEFYHAASHFMGSHTYHGVHFGYLYLFHTDTSRKVREDGVRLAGTVETSLMFSRDTLSWTRVDRNRRFLPLGPEGSWDGQMNFLMPEVPVGDKLHFYYCGFQKDHASTQNSASIGLATLPRDRFVSLQPTEQEGSLVTKPFVLNGNNLYLNTNADGGQVRVAVLDAQHSAQKGLGVNHCVPLKGDKLSARVVWRGSKLSELRGKSIRLEIHLKNAELFSFRVR